MNVSINLWTDIALLIIFDAAEFESSGAEPDTFFTFEENKDVQDGRYAFVDLGGDQTFRLRITDDQLTVREREHINETLGPLGLIVSSGQAYVSGMDTPGEPPDDYARHGAGGFVSIAPGEYNLFVHEMDSIPLSKEDHEELPDYVMELHPRREPFQGVSKEPRFTGGRDFERLMEELEGNG